MYQKGYKEFRIFGLYLGDYSKKFYLREISKHSKLPLRTTQRVLGELEKTRVIRSEVQGRNKYFSPNLENIRTMPMLLQAEAYKTIEFLEKYPFFKMFLKEIKRVSGTIIAFGSFAKFTADKMSDVDLLIISNKKMELPTHLLPNKIHEIHISEGNFIKAFEKNEILIKKIRESHVILNNHSFFVNLMWDKYAK